MTIEEALSFEGMRILGRKSINIESVDLAIPLVTFANAEGGIIAVGISDMLNRVRSGLGSRAFFIRI